MMNVATMKKMIMIMVVGVMMMGGMVEGRRRVHWLRQRGCRRAAGEGVMQEGPGQYFMWTMMGLDDDDLRMTYYEGAFVPEGATHVFMYPRDRGQRALNLVPAKLVYDFTDPDNQVVAIRKARRGKGVCIVMRSDVTSYDEMRTQLQERNVTNRDVVSEDRARKLAVGAPSDPSQFSEVLRNICSQDLCGNPVEAVFYMAEEADAEEVEQEDEEADNQGAMSDDRSYMLFDERVVISGQQPTGWMWRRGRMGQRGPRGPASGPRAHRQQRRQQRRQERLHRRQQRRGEEEQE